MHSETIQGGSKGHTDEMSGTIHVCCLTGSVILKDAIH
jgi:hypothetical protein